MTDIVERLRLLGKEYWQHKRYYDEAADEIERLRERVASLSASYANVASLKYSELEEEIERLRNQAANWQVEALRLADVANARQAEIERLHVLALPEWYALKAEIEKLRTGDGIGSVKRAYADGYAAAQHEIEQLLARLTELIGEKNALLLELTGMRSDLQ